MCTLADLYHTSTLLHTNAEFAKMDQQTVIFFIIHLVHLIIIHTYICSITFNLHTYV